jgi:hypothetical protein
MINNLSYPSTTVVINNEDREWCDSIVGNVPSKYVRISAQKISAQKLGPKNFGSRNRQLRSRTKNLQIRNGSFLVGAKRCEVAPRAGFPDDLGAIIEAFSRM